MSKRYLYFIVYLFCALPVGAQTLSQQVNVDAYLRLTFPKRPSHYDAKDITAFSTTVNHTTYELTKIVKKFPAMSEQQHGELMDKLAQRWIEDSLYEGLTKQVTDSVISGTRGRFVKMGRRDQTKPLFVFIFLTIRGTNIYILKCSSSKQEANALADARHFYEGVVFQAE
jgi:hypothetical protein